MQDNGFGYGCLIIYTLLTPLPVPALSFLKTKCLHPASPALCGSAAVWSEIIHPCNTEPGRKVMCAYLTFTAVQLDGLLLNRHHLQVEERLSSSLSCQRYNVSAYCGDAKINALHQHSVSLSVTGSFFSTGSIIHWNMLMQWLFVSEKLMHVCDIDCVSLNPLFQIWAIWWRLCVVWLY